MAPVDRRRGVGDGYQVTPAPRTFDADRQRELLRRDLKRLESLTDSRVAATAIVDCAVAMISGLAAEAQRVIPRAVSALESDSELSPRRQREETREPHEYYVRSAEVLRLMHLGIARWMRDGSPQAATFAATAAEQERAIEAGRALTPSIDSTELDAYMIFSVLGRTDAGALEFYPPLDPKARAPLQIARAQSDRRVAEAICRHRRSGEFTAEEIRSAVDRLIRKNATTWLTTGWEPQAPAVAHDSLR